MKKIEERLLNELLNRYERSKGFVEKRAQRRRVLLQMYGGGKTDFPLYDIEDSSIRKAVNQVAEDLAAQGWIQLEWMEGQEGHILSRIALRPEAVEQIYQRIHRTPLADTVSQLENLLAGSLQKVTAPWAKGYLDDQLRFLERHRHPEKAFPTGAGERTAWLKVLEALGTGSPEHPVLERVFSLECLGDSKAFERSHRSRLLSVLRKHLPMDTEEMTEEELLRQVGLEKYPEWFALWGGVRFSWPEGGFLDGSSLRDGLRISAVDVPQAEISFAPQVRTLLFVENLANYYHTIRNHPQRDRVVVFHGGWYSPQRGRFFKQLCQSAGPHRELLHWGDLDLGGLEMDSRLRREIDPRITPWRMDLTQLETHLDRAVEFSEKYAAKLERLLQDPYSAGSYDLIRGMLRYRRRLEQEALLES